MLHAHCSCSLNLSHTPLEANSIEEHYSDEEDLCETEYNFLTFDSIKSCVKNIGCDRYQMMLCCRSVVCSGRLRWSFEELFVISGTLLHGVKGMVICGSNEHEKKRSG